MYKVCDSVPFVASNKQKLVSCRESQSLPKFKMKCCACLKRFNKAVITANGKFLVVDLPNIVISILLIRN